MRFILKTIVSLFLIFFTTITVSPNGFQEQSVPSGIKSDSPKILFIGDSVLIGCKKFIINSLEDEAEICFKGGEAIDSEYVLKNIKHWISEEKWDLIYVSFGLDDIKIHDPISNPLGNWEEEGGINTLAMEYEDRLREIALILSKLQTRIVWGTITPVPVNNVDVLLRRDWGGGISLPEGILRWFPYHVERYNKISIGIMQEYGIYVHDIYAEVLPKISTIQKKNSPYFTDWGYDFLGKRIVEYIRELVKVYPKINFSKDVITILDTDIGPWLDIDDWFDVMMYSMSDLSHGGIIMEHYASDWEEAALKKFLKWLGKKNMSYARGSQRPLRRSKEGKIILQGSEDGADLILNTMQNTDKKIRIVCVGALTNVAYAYIKDPEVFISKIESVWFSGGMLGGYEYAHSLGRWDTNIHRDQVAADVIFNNDIPLVWFPVSLEILVRSTGIQEKMIRDIEHPAIKWLYNGVNYWRKRRGKIWAAKTQQQEDGDGRRMWAVPIHAALNDKTGKMRFKRGNVSFSTKDWTTFIENTDGQNLILVNLDKKDLAQWYQDFIISCFSEH